TDAVFENLPDTLLAPSAGPTQTVTADFGPDYWANDFFDDGAVMPIDPFGPLHDWEQMPGEMPNFMPADLGIEGVAYDWQGYGQWMPFGLLGNHDPGTGTPANTGADEILPGGPIGVGDAPGVLPLRDLVRDPQIGLLSAPLPGVYVDPMHFSGAKRLLLDPNQTPGAIGVGGYSQATVPTSQLAQQLADGGSTAAPSSTPSTFGALQTKSEPSGGGSETPPAPNDEAQPANPEWMQADSGSTEPVVADAGNGYKIVAFFVPADPAKEQKVENDRATEQAGQP